MAAVYVCSGATHSLMPDVRDVLVAGRGLRSACGDRSRDPRRRVLASAHQLHHTLELDMTCAAITPDYRVIDVAEMLCSSLRLRRLCSSPGLVPEFLRRDWPLGGSWPFSHTLAPLFQLLRRVVLEQIDLAPRIVRLPFTSENTLAVSLSDGSVLR